MVCEQSNYVRQSSCVNENRVNSSKRLSYTSTAFTRIPRVSAAKSAVWTLSVKVLLSLLRPHQTINVTLSKDKRLVFRLGR